MKMRSVLIPLFAFLGFAAHASAQAEMEKGEIMVMVSQGDVTIVDNATGSSEPLASGQIIEEGYTIVTGGESFASLAFANGTQVNINESTSLEIRKFRMLASDFGFGEFEALVAEPTQSETSMYLNNGQVVGDTKPLNSESNFMIRAELGTLKVIGTSWVFTANPGVSLSAAAVTGTITLVNDLNGSSQTIPAPNQIFITEVDGSYVFSGMEELPPETQQAFQDQLIAALQQGSGTLDGLVPADEAGGAPAGPGAGLPAATFSTTGGIDATLLSPTPTATP